MNIVPNDNSVSMYGWKWYKNIQKRVKQAALDAGPFHTAKDSQRTREFQDKINNMISHPAWNRAIMGASAIVTQPAIDACNHRVDDETRQVSINRTIAKVAVGTTVGIAVRDIVYRLTEKMTNVEGTSKFSKALLPKDYVAEIAKNPNYLKNHRSAIAMLVALGVMLFTNFFIDAPLTIFFTNLLNDKDKEKLAQRLKQNDALANSSKKSEVKYA